MRSARRALHEPMTIKIDVHQHVWSEPLVLALEQRHELPFVRREHGLTVLFLADERPYVIDMSSETAPRRHRSPQLTLARRRSQEAQPATRPGTPHGFVQIIGATAS